MKLLFIVFNICLGAITPFAQNKIVITYDNNGNRIKRELVCPGCKPAPEEDPRDPAVDLISGQAQSESPEDVLKGDFEVYPNPANNSVTISLDAIFPERRCEIVLIDQLGKEHFRKVVISTITTIPLSHLAEGMYYVRICRDKQKDVVKIVKESSGYSR